MDASTEDIVREDGSRVVVGSRVESEGCYATVKYIGAIPATTGTWLGVDWDEPDRGKHDGTHSGVRYFNTTHSRSGSFLRPKKVTLGVPCFSAICDRYGKIEDENAGVEIDELFVRGPKNRRIVVEMVGAKSVNEKQSKLDRLQKVGMTGMSIYGGGPAKNLQKYTPSITELDLSINLIPSWSEVAYITSQLDELESLNVSANRLCLPPDPSQFAAAFKNVQTVFLNRMSYTWEEIVLCCSMLPRLQTLHACFNHICEISGPGTCLRNLTLLNLEFNQISCWGEILHLAPSLTLLETLIVNDNQIESFDFPDCTYTEKTKMFPKLKSLSISRNKISQWSSFNELNKLESLCELKMNQNPIVDSDTANNIREFLIAKIARLQLFNRSEVPVEERRGAEIDYLKKFGKQWKEAGGDDDPLKNNPSHQFLQDHPRFMELVKALGAPEDAEMKEESKTLKDSLISVKLCSPLTDKIVQKKLPLTMSVQKLKTLIQRLYKVDNGDIKLSYLSQKMEGPEIEFDNDLRQLSFYSIETGDTIKVLW